MYIYRFFDKQEITKADIVALFAERKLDFALIQAFDNAVYKQTTYDRLAEQLRHSLDSHYIDRILNRKL